MIKKPILTFPLPISAEKSKKQGFPGKMFIPTKAQQIERNDQKISELDRVLSNQSASLQKEAGNIIPEMILVLETAGEITDFFKAVKRTPGMEFLAELEIEFEADDNFYNINNRDERSKENIDGRFYLTMTNQRALKELQKYWKEYKKEQKFKRGTAKFKALFSQLKDIRPYNISDRVRDTGIKEYIEERKLHDFEFVKFEIELAFKDDDKFNREAYEEVTNLLHLHNGEVIKGSRTLISDISYHAFIARAPIQVFDDLSENTKIFFLKSQQILFFRPVGQMVFETPADNKQLKKLPDVGSTAEAPNNKNPVIALFDGLPLANHSLLENRLQIDDPDGFSNNYIGNQRFHGTAMASLIIHGDLDNEKTTAQTRPLYVRPIMKLGTLHYQGEQLPDDVLPIDLIHRAVLRMKQGDAENPPVAPEVKIINFSIGDAFRPFLNNMSSWAKLLDWLSYEYDILFVISAGNFSDNITLSISEAEFDTLSDDEIQKLALEEIVRTNYNRKILTPAESINSITVGAAHYDFSKPTNLYQRKNLIKSSSLLSPISRIGFGFRRSIKPEILMAGGRKLFRKSPIQNVSEKTILKIESTPLNNNPPGNKVAFPGNLGQLNKSAYMCGTSNSAALTSRLAGQLYDVLMDIGSTAGNSPIPSSFLTVIIKSLLVHSASWNESSDYLLQLIKNLSGSASNTSRKNILPYLGYGSIDPQRILYCTEKRVTIIGYGKLANGQANLYRFPLPPSLSKGKIDKKLTITLAYLSPLNFKTRQYRKAQLFFDNLAHNNHLELDRSYYDFRASQLGTVQHDILVGDKADVFVDGDFLEIKVNCREDASELGKLQVKYGLSVTLEVKEATDIKIYEEVKQRVQTRIRPNI
tara:strand:+ start:11941 stop:14547 length:2607 start_codon:yes stop_codon:yes gene_type:complete